MMTDLGEEVWKATLRALRANAADDQAYIKEAEYDRISTQLSLLEHERDIAAAPIGSVWRDHNGFLWWTVRAGEYVGMMTRDLQGQVNIARAILLDGPFTREPVTSWG